MERRGEDRRERRGDRGEKGRRGEEKEGRAGEGRVWKRKRKGAGRKERKKFVMNKISACTFRYERNVALFFSITQVN